jgi:hypothetical protein
MEEFKPSEYSDYLSEDTLFERIVWQGLIWLTYSVFTGLFLVAILS